ncbi:MAG: hypothetical protein ACM309_09465 [Bacillota bacterium]
MRFGLRPLTVVDVLMCVVIVIVAGSLCAFAAIGLAVAFGW